MKKKILLLLITMAILGLNGCGDSENKERINDLREEAPPHDTVFLPENNTTNNDVLDEEITSNCVTLPEPNKGLSYTHKTTSPTTSGTTNIKTTILDVTSTSSTASRITSGAMTATNITTNLFTIDDNYRDISKVITTEEIIIQGQTIKSDSTLTFSPFLRVASNKVCKEQKWTSTYDLDLNVTTDGRTSTSVVPKVIKNNIESIDEIKTTALDSYVTVKMIIDHGTVIITTWTDITTGIIVYEETHNESGVLLSTRELI